MEKLSKFIYMVVCFVFFLLTDLYLSNEIIRNIANGFTLHNNVFRLNYVKNTGAAFSLLPNAREFLIIFSVVLITLFFVYVYKHLKSISLKTIFTISVLCAGIAGNLHERIVFGFVRDFFEFTCFNFPVFNLSDVFINIGVVILIILILAKKTA